MSGLSAQGVFISYRREDAAPYARLLQYQLRERISDVPVFIDMDSVEAGLDFVEVIRDAVSSCVVLLALIGRQWATLADEDGHRRLDDPDDYVRFEIQTALERGIRVIPVLVDGARPLRQQQLPLELQKLARLNAIELSYGRYEYDADRLLTLIRRVVDGASSISAAAQSMPAVNTKNFAVPFYVRYGGNVILPDPDRAIRLIADAERIAQSITDERDQVYALADIAKALAAIDPDRATRLIADAQRITQVINNEDSKSSASAQVAKALAAIDPDRAERIAQSITDERDKACALAEVAEALAATDPDHAIRLIAEAERIAQSIIDEYSKGNVLVWIAEALAAIDPDRAERIAQSISDEGDRACALANVAWVLTATDPERATHLVDDAERIAQSITDENSKASVLANIAWALRATDPNRATHLIQDVERIAQSITDENSKANALAGAATALAPIDPDRAERIAGTLTHNYQKILAILTIAEPRISW